MCIRDRLRPLLPVTDAAGLGVATAAFSVAFFGVAFALALRPGLLSRVLGRFSAPALILLIVLVVGASVLGGAPAPTAPQPPYDASPLSNGFLTGYQTMDLLLSLIHISWGSFRRWLAQPLNHGVGPAVKKQSVAGCAARRLRV